MLTGSRGLLAVLDALVEIETHGFKPVRIHVIDNPTYGEALGLLEKDAIGRPTGKANEGEVIIYRRTWVVIQDYIIALLTRYGASSYISDINNPKEIAGLPVVGIDDE